MSRTLLLSLDDATEAKLAAMVAEHGIKRAAIVSAIVRAALASDGTAAIVEPARAIHEERRAHGEKVREAEAAKPRRTRYKVLLDPVAEKEMERVVHAYGVDRAAFIGSLASWALLDSAENQDAGDLDVMRALKFQLSGGHCYNPPALPKLDLAA
jgi:hypothetical protein